MYVHDLEFSVTAHILDDTTAEQSCHHASSAKWTVVPTSGPLVKSSIWRRLRKFWAILKMSILLFSKDCHQARALVRLPHRQRRTHRVPFRVQQDYEVTSGNRPPKTKTKQTRKTTIKQGEIDCEILQSGLRSSDNLEDTEVSALGHTKIQIWSVPRKWITRSTAFISIHCPNVRDLQEKEDYKGPKRWVMQHLVQTIWVIG